MRLVLLASILAAATATEGRVPPKGAGAGSRPPVLKAPDAPKPLPGEGTAPAPVVFEQQAILPADGPYRVRLENVRGRVVVKRWNKNVVWASATVRATRALSGSGLEYFKAAAMRLSMPEPDEVSIQTVWRGVRESYPAVVATKAAHVDVDYMLAVPPETALEVRQEYGPIVAAGLDGKLELFTRDGDVLVADARGWVDAGNERGNVTIRSVTGDAVGRTFHGKLRFSGVTGDVRAIATTGAVRIDVPARWVGEVSFHTVSGAFRSDLATFGTDLEPGDTGYVGVMRGPLAGTKEPPLVRVRVDTASGEVVLAAERTAGPFR